MDAIAGPAGLIDIVVDKLVTNVSLDDKSNAHHVLSEILVSLVNVIDGALGEIELLDVGNINENGVDSMDVYIGADKNVVIV